ncbi:MAG: hypothetical protein SV760_03670 [Halobacteria archaeon]|nr:hypothetical protein [Halobacteria archaeon]
MVFENVRDRLSEIGSEDDEETVDVVMPSDSKVIKRVSNEVDLDSEEVEDAVKKFQEVGNMIYPTVEEKAVGEGESSGGEKEEGSPEFLYEIDENQATLVVGGAKNIVHNLAERIGLSQVEVKAVRMAQRVAADANGYAEHVVMDDIFMLPKEQRFPSRFDSMADVESDGRTQEEMEERMRRIRETDEEGYEMGTPKLLSERLDLEERKYFNVRVETLDGGIALVLDPQMGRGEYDAIIYPDASIKFSRSLGEALDLRNRETQWGVDDGEFVVVVENDLHVGRTDIGQEVKTSVMENETVVDGETKEVLRAHLSGGHVRTAGVEEGDRAVVRLQSVDDEIWMVFKARWNVKGDVGDESIVEVENMGEGTEMMCFTVPEGMVDVLGLEEASRIQMEWGTFEPENAAVGHVIEQKGPA